MAITNYTELKAAVANWLGRTDLTDRIPEFIALAEADIGRNLRKQVIRDTLTLDSAAVALPDDCAELRSIRLNASSQFYFPIQITTPVGLSILREAGSGVPQYAAVVDNTLLLDITPDSDYETEIVYFEALTALSDSAPTNSTLTSAPDIYLYATLKEAELYLEHDERNPVWTAKYLKALTDENNARERAELGGSPTVIGLPVVIG
jgi:hypothetical protein